MSTGRPSVDDASLRQLRELETSFGASVVEALGGKAVTREPLMYSPFFCTFQFKLVIDNLGVPSLENKSDHIVKGIRSLYGSLRTTGYVVTD